MNTLNIYVLFFVPYERHVYVLTLRSAPFALNELVFLVTPQGIEVDEVKIEAIKSWPIPATLTKLWSFFGLAEFYQCFMRDFSTSAAPLNDLTKKGVSFCWGAAQDQDFHTLINKLTHAPLLQLSDFCTTFELECDASGIGIGGVLLQEGKPVA
jgi:hypothetical protein